MSSNSRKDLFVKTPLIESMELRELCPRRVYLKLENCQPSGSFKMRGISRLCQEAKNKGCEQIICSSGGNAGLAAATAARLLGLKCKIFVPNFCTELMKNKIKREGAILEVHGQVWNETNEIALQELIKSDNNVFVHPFDHPLIWSGHSTIIDEIAEELDTTPSMIISNCGGGGLLCGLIEGMRRHNWTSVPLLAMETFGANSLNAAISAGSPVVPKKTPEITSIAKSLGSLIICEQLADDCNKGSPPILSHLVEDKDVVDACIRFANQHRMIVEPACGAALSALYTGLVKKLFEENSVHYSDGPVVVVICGGAAITLQMLQKYKQEFAL